MVAVCVKDLKVHTVFIFSKNALYNTYDQNNQLFHPSAVKRFSVAKVRAQKARSVKKNIYNELHNLYSAPIIIRVIKSRRMNGKVRTLDA
jgi:hypothetical protein